MRPSTRWPILLAITAALSITAAPLIAHAVASAPNSDPVVGTWRLNVARSRYVPGPAPRSETRTYEADGDAIKATIRRVLADGRAEVVTYTANFDNPAPVTGSPQMDRILMQRIDAYTAESVLSHAGRVFAVARRIIAPDGRTMTITLRRPGDALVNNVAHYDRETP